MITERTIDYCKSQPSPSAQQQQQPTTNALYAQHHTHREGLFFLLLPTPRLFIQFSPGGDSGLSSSDINSQRAHVKVGSDKSQGGCCCCALHWPASCPIKLQAPLWIRSWVFATSEFLKGVTTRKSRQTSVSRDQTIIQHMYKLRRLYFTIAKKKNSTSNGRSRHTKYRHNTRN